jgi:outer membrane protein
MKKLSLALVLGLSFASADLLSVSAGAGLWKEKVDGYVKLGDTINYFNNKSAETDGNSKTGNFGLEDKTNPYVWIKFIHPVPIIPNVKAQYTKYDSTGHSNYIAGNVKIFGDVNIDAPIINANTSQTINSLDLTFFYEIKPVFADIEAGFGVDIWKGNTQIHGNNKLTNINEDWAVILPYLYGHIETMKLFGFSAIANIKWAKAGDNHHYDNSFALKYTIDILGPINPFIKVGYRYKEAYGVDGDNETLLKYKGVFAEIGAKF